MALQSDGKIILGGVAELDRFLGGFAVVKLTPNGAFDTSFGNGTGRVVTILGEGVDGGLGQVVNDMLLQPDGKIVLAGTSSFYSTDRDFTLVRYENFIARSISGRVTTNGTTGVPGVTMKLTGSVTATVQTDASGNYMFGNLPGSGNYSVMPSKLGYTFNPASQDFSELSTNVTANFIATKSNFSISGKVIKTGTTTGLSDVTMKLTGSQVASVTTGADGQYTFANLPAGGNYTIKPSIIGYSFTPAARSLSNLSANQANQNFSAKVQNYSLSGVVKLGATGLSGVTVTLSSPTPAGFPARTATTSSTGAYSFTGVPAGRNYTVTPTKIGYQFTPTNKAISNLSANQTAINFLVKVFSISGKITRTGTTTGISAVTVTLTSPTPAGFAARTVMTNSTGSYTFTNVPAGRNYTLKPTKTGFTFSPTMKSITNLSNNVPAGASTNFTGTGP